MRRERIEADQAFFTERLAQRGAGRGRSLLRARALAPHLDVRLDTWGEHPERVITVVGSKGKGTAATFASAALAGAGLRVGTLTSPGLRSNRERIRVDGLAVPRRDYEALVGEVAATLARVSDLLPDDGYISPSGLFTLSALRHFADRGCDVVVLEAGMGGASDEVSLLAPGVVVVTPILSEHIGVLGDTVAEIATEKAGVITAATHDVVAAAQADRGAGMAVQLATRRHGCRLHQVGDRADRPGPELASGFGGVNARLGVVAALRLLQLAGRTEPEPAAMGAWLRSVSLPGRLSHHRHGGQDWVIDCATNPAAIATAIAHATTTVGPPTTVLTFVPHHRDADPLLAALGGQAVVRVPGGRSTGGPGGGAVMRLDEVDFGSLGPRVLALGPVYFVGELLATLDIDCERSFRASRC